MSGVGQVEGTAKRVAQLVVERHVDRTETYTAEPGAIEGLVTRVLTLWLHLQNRKRFSQGLNTLAGHEPDDGVGVAGVERLHCVQVSARLPNSWYNGDRKGSEN